MSSSEYLQRPEFVDLRQGQPPARRREFVPQAEFERVDRDPPNEITPEAAHRKGVSEGERLGRESALKELTPVIEELRTLMLALADLRAQRLAELEGELVGISSELARRVLRGELRQDGDTVLHMARACLSEAADQGVLVLQVAPVDLDLVRTHAAELETDLSEASLTIRAEASIQPGCVVLETPTRVFDGRPERILAAATREPAHGVETPALDPESGDES